MNGRRDRRDVRGGAERFRKPPLRVFTTTLWEYPSQDYEGFKRGEAGAEAESEAAALEAGK